MPPLSPPLVHVWSVSSLDDRTHLPAKKKKKPGYIRAKRKCFANQIREEMAVLCKFFSDKRVLGDYFYVF